MLTESLTAIVDGKIWCSERQLWFSGVKLRARTTFVRLGDGSLLVHSPAPLTDPITEQLRDLGPVKWLVIPNRFHHRGTPAAMQHFPDARVVGPASVIERNGAVKLNFTWGDPRLHELLPEFEGFPLEGVPFLDETLLLHRPTQTLLGADIVLSANHEDHWTWRYAARITGCYGRLRVPPDVTKKIVDKRAAAQSLQRLLDTLAQRLVVAHAPVVEQNWREGLAQAWQKEGVSP